jgi:hypothetical protein
MSNISIRESVLVPGTVGSSEGSATCTVKATKITIPRLDVWEYVSAEVFQAPAELPDGAYEVIFDGRKMKVEKVAGSWQARPLYS